MESPPMYLKSSFGTPIRVDLDLDERDPVFVDLAEIMESKTPISVEDSKYYSVGTMSVQVKDGSAFIKVRDTYWHFKPTAYKGLPPPEMKTLGELTLPVSVVSKKNWFTTSKDWHEQCLKAVTWISFLFPYTRKEFLTYDWINRSQYFSGKPWHELEFRENKMHAMYGLRSEIMFKHAANERDVTVLYTIASSSDGRGVQSKFFYLEPIPIDVRDWFRTFEPESFQCLLLSSKQIREKHLNSIIKKWTRDELEDLVIVRAKYVEDLNMSEVNEGLNVMRRKDVEMRMKKYAKKTRFSKFYEEPCYYVVSRSGRLASFHYYPTQGHFFFVVWDSKDDEDVFSLLHDLNLHQDMKSEPIPFAPFDFYGVPENLFIELVRKIRMPELLVMLEMCPLVKEYASRYVSDVELRLVRFNHFIIHVGELSWEFTPSPYEKKPTMKRVGPFMLPVEERNSMWYTKTDDCCAQGLKVAAWILQILPRTKFESSLLLALTITPEQLQLVSTIDFEKCTETDFLIDFLGDAKPSFTNQIKNKDLIALYIKRRDYEQFRANAINLKIDQELGVRCDYWFRICSPRKWNFLLTSTPKVTEEHLHHIISRWMEDDLSGLIYFRATKLEKLEKAKIFAGLEAEEWNDIAMDEYQSKVHFAKFFEQKGTVFKSKSDRCASFHHDEAAGICHFVVWSSTMSELSLQLFHELDLYQSVPTQET